VLRVIHCSYVCHTPVIYHRDSGEILTTLPNTQGVRRYRNNGILLKRKEEPWRSISIRSMVCSKGNSRNFFARRAGVRELSRKCGRPLSDCAKRSTSLSL